MLLFFLLYATTTGLETYRTVQTRFGAIRGKSISSYGGHTAFAFSGIPMAAPPLGKLRFKSAVEPQPWSGVLDTLQYRNACIADPVRTYKTDAGGPISEDCLYSNVFTSKKCLNTGGCAVMAVLHGGIFKFESPVIFRQEVVINNFANEERNVVVVTLPYRLGILGLFQLEQEMKTSTDSNIVYRDCIFGLQWVQREIQAFGGDPSKVTLMGHSAGGILTQTLALSPATSGLFTQFISMSGSTAGGDISKGINIKYSRAVSKLLGCASQNETFSNAIVVEKVIDCLRSKDELEILAAQKLMNNQVEEITFPWIDGSNGIFPTYLKELEKSPRKLNVLIGTVTGEFRDVSQSFEDGRMNPTKLDEICTFIGYLRNYERPEKFVSYCNNFYGNSTAAGSMDDDYLFYAHTARMADLFSSTNAKAYVYSFEYTGVGKVFQKNSKKLHPEPNHSEDYVYIFGLHRDDTAMTAKDFEIERIYSGMLANFVNFGDPTYENKWTQWDSNNKNYFVVDFDKKLKMPGMKNGYYKEAYDFWEIAATNAAGQWTPLETFPLRQDSYFARSILTSMISAWNNESTSIDKTLPALVETYDEWVPFVRDLKHNRELQISSNFAEESHKDYEATFNWVTISLAAVVILLVIYIVIDKVWHYKKRRDYNSLE